MKYTNTKAIFSSLAKIAEECDEEKSQLSRDQKIKAHTAQIKLLGYELNRAKQRSDLGHLNVSIRDIEATGFDTIISNGIDK